MNCPLCASSKPITVMRVPLGALREKWRRTYDFDPFDGIQAKGDHGNLIRAKCMECGLLHHAPVVIGDGAFYSKLSQYPWYYEGQKWEFTVAAEAVVTAGARSVLEFGCGSGEFLDNIKHAVPHTQGLELSETSVAACRDKGLNVTLDAGHGVVGKFDAVALFQVLEHVERPAQVLERLVAHLNPGGLLLIAVPNPDNPAFADESSLLDMPPHHYTAWTEQAFAFAARKFGLTLVKRELEPLRYVHYLGYLSWLIEAQKRATGPLSLKKKLLFKLRMQFAVMMAPLHYLAARKELCGHTQLLVFRK